MKRTLTNQPFIPKGYTGRNFNEWQYQLQKERDKVLKTDVAKKLKQKQVSI